MTAFQPEPVERGYHDPVWFCRYFLEHLFGTPMPWVHRGILALISNRTGFLWEYGEIDTILREFVERDGRSIFVLTDKETGKPLESQTVIGRGPHDTDIRIRVGRYLCVRMPRGFSKTTLVGLAIPLHDILYQEVPLFAYVSETASHAEMQVNNIRGELQGNERIIEHFGNLVPERSEGLKWSERFFETRSGIAMVARGAGSQIRGLNHRGNRPKQILIDDPDDEESVETELQRKKRQTWLYKAVVPALSELDPDCTLRMLGTTLHEDCLVASVQKDPEWTCITFGVHDSQGRPIWPENMDTDKYERRKLSYARMRQLRAFYMEYDNEVTADELAKFRAEDFRYVPVVPELVAVATYCDPAISQVKGADECVVLTAGITAQGLFVFLAGRGEVGMNPREAVDEFFAQSLRWGSIKHGVESNAYQASLVHTMQEEMFRKKRYFEVEKVTHVTRKPERIMGIFHPRLVTNNVVYAPSFPMDRMRDQALTYDVDRKEQPDDWLDAAAGVISLLDPYASLAADTPFDNEDDIPDIEEVIGGSWEVA